MKVLRYKFIKLLLIATVLPAVSSRLLAQQNNTVLNTNMNTIVTYNVRVPGIANPALTTHLASQVNVDVQTLNHFGMVKETQRVKAAPDFKDLIELVKYDGLGRVATNFLPYAINTGSANFIHMGYSSNVTGYYIGSGKTPSIAYNSVPYVQTIFDNSPLSRVLETTAPGSAFALGSGHTTRTNVMMVENDIAKYSVAINSSTNSRKLTRLATNLVYTSLDLVKYSVKDENVTGTDGVVYEYKNHEGQVILKRQHNFVSGGTQVLSTYYVYDDLGNLCFVIPPLAEGDGVGVPGTTVMHNLCYQYHYDAQQRMIAKKVPGKGWEYMVYNSLNQMVMSQDSMQRSKTPNQQWNVIKYDASGRTVITGIFTSSHTPGGNNRSAIQSSVDSQSSQWESRITTGNGYTSVTYPTSWTNTLSVSYYDDYNFPGGNPYPYAGSDASSMTRGLLTGSKTAVLGTASDMLWAVNYYDTEGRTVRSFKQHYKGAAVIAGNYDEVSNTYDFTGAVLTSNRSHKVSGTEMLKSLTEYTYDHRGRKIDTWQTMNTGTRTLLSRMEYDDLGQPYKKKLHSTNSGSSFLQTITYGYTERGWLKTASASLFSFELSYDIPFPSSGGTAQYNGNISGLKYTAPTSGTKSFNYTYDKINRLSESVYYPTNALNETIQYDKNGNITYMRRGLPTNAPINYFYVAGGLSNQLNNVTGSVGGGFNYDGNGNTLVDGTRGATLTYNDLNLPKTATISSTQVAAYTYDASGNKLKSVQGSLIMDYISGVHYKNGVLDFMATDEGRVVRNSTTGLYRYEYNLKDHLGNVRLSFDDNAGTARLIQEDEYYAFGLVSPKIVSGDKNNYLYNGKELQTGLANIYDYGARFYDPVIGRWHVIDPLAEKYNLVSPYNYADNNPINNIDPDGQYVVYGASAQMLFGILQQQPYNRPASFNDENPPKWLKYFGLPTDFFKNFQNYAKNELNHLRNRGRSYESALIAGNDPSVVDDQYEYNKAVHKLKLLGDAIELYGFSIAGAETSAGGTLLRRSEFAFHSGKGSISAAAEAGYKTLGKTRAGKNLANLTRGMEYKEGSEAYNMWAKLSAAYAESFPNGSTAHVFINNPSQMGIFLKVEKPTLERKGINIITHTIK